MKNAATKTGTGKPICARMKRIVAILLLVALAASLVPLYAAARYSYAGVDDYRYGLTTHAVWEETHSFAKTVAEAGRVAARTYGEWQGSVAAIFLMALQPGVFDSGAYGVSTVILLSVLVLALLCFTWVACVRAFNMDADAACIIAALVAIACVQFVPSPVESYFWFNGGVYYTFFFSLSLFAASLLILRACRRTAIQAVFLIPLMLLIGLGNLVTGLLFTVLLLGYTGWATLRKRNDPLLWILTAALLIAFAVNVFSPGNAVRRMEHTENAQSAFAAIFSAIRDALVYSGRWLATPAAFLLLLPIPLYWRAAPASGLRFRWPLLISAVSLLLLAVGFTPNEYALGFAGEARIIDIQYYQFVLLLALNLFWYTGWLQRRLRLSERAARSAAVLIMCAAFLAACAVTIVTRNMASASAVLMQANGKAQSYADTWERRLTLLQEDAQREIILPKCESQPPLLCMVDIAPSKEDPFYFYNEQLAAYYGKETVLREP